jgi:hypothetical protein
VDRRCIGRFTGSNGSSETPPARSARARATALRHRPWESGRIGKIERHVSRKLMCADQYKLFSTGELARPVYADRTWDQDFRLRKEGDPPPKIKSWMYDRVRRAAPNFADKAGRSTGRGRPWLWRIRPNQYWADVRRAKSKRQRAYAENPSSDRPRWPLSHRPPGHHSDTGGLRRRSLPGPASDRHHHAGWKADVSGYRRVCRVRAQHDPPTCPCWPEAGRGCGQAAWQAADRSGPGKANPESNCGPARACSRLPPSAALAAVRFSVSGGRWLGRPALSKAQARPRKATIRRAKTGVMNSIRPCCERRCALLLGRQPSLHRNKSSYALVNKKLIGSLVL